MKKFLSISIFVIFGLAVIIAIYRFSFRKSIPEAPVEEQVASVLEQNGCFQCHSNSGVRPFYASFPVIGEQMDAHITHGTRFVELEEASKDLANVSEVTLAMIEDAVMKDNMPLMEYKMIHWGTGFNKEEKSLLTQWIMDVRSARFATGLASDEYKNDPLQALPCCIPTDSAKVALGQKMYNDTRISLDNTLSCATCHILKDGGADSRGTRTSEGINGQFGGINAPTVYNAYYNVKQFWNGRAADLQMQAAGPPANPIEMGDQTWEQIVERLSQDAALVAEFNAIYPEGLTEGTVTNAIAEYEKTLTNPNTKLDKYLKGDANAFNDNEKAGYQAFLDNSCQTCHVGKTLGGQSFEFLGIFEDYFAARDSEIAYNADDDGLKGFTGNEGDLHRFKVPNLRLISKTAPYFHDGSMATVEDAVRAMFRFQYGKTADETTVNNISEFLKSGLE